ncbi:MAG TPA: hemerythrin family protein [Thermoanaerobaculia bacterium]
MNEPDTSVREEPTGLEDVNAEHAMQYKLLAEAERLLAAGDGARAREVAQHLYDYTEAHFASEQVLMRLHSYPQYQSHVREHGELLAALHILIDDLTGNASTAAGALRQWLSTHIHHSDQEFVEFVQEEPRTR